MVRKIQPAKEIIEEIFAEAAKVFADAGRLFAD